LAPQIALALLSGVPALVYEVAWTRRVALVAGSHVEAVSVVVAAFFGGLALGAHLLGPRADRAARPLAFYAALELAAGACALASLPALAAVEAQALPGPTALLLCAAALLPSTFSLGGTLPALARSAASEERPGARVAGRILGANTAGSVLGVVAAAVAIPTLGLRLTLLGGVGLSFLAAAAALAASPRVSRAVPPLPPGLPAPAVRAGVLGAAAAAGAATLAFEVVAARATALRLGSSLLAWAAVLALFLLGLALGNWLLAPRAGRSPRPARDLGLVECGAVLALGLSLALLVPDPAAPAIGLTPRSLAAVLAGVLPPALFMGAAFPLLVRLAAAEPASLGAAVGRVSAANTAGGIAGALSAPFLLLPTLGPGLSVLACAAANAALAAVFLAADAPLGRAAARALPAGLALLLAAIPLGLAPRGPAGARAIHVDHGRQATAVVLHLGGRRDLVVDGDPEASTGGDARRTEELLAALPAALHPAPRRFLEVGLGSGITLAEAARLPLERIDCVEISGAVIRSARFFAPQNGPVTGGGDPRLRVVRGDGRAFLARHADTYDLVVANTVHPWSVGATGLYSRAYFERTAAALRAGGLAAQWIPVERIGADDLAAILRTFYAAFPHGAVFWGAENLIAIGSASPLREPPPDGLAGLPGADGPRRRRLADAPSVRRVLGPEPLLRDDRPALEARAAGRRATGAGPVELAMLVRLARAGVEAGAGSEPLLRWLESRHAHAGGRIAEALRLESRAVAAGLALAQRARAARRAAEGRAALIAGRRGEARRAFRAARADVPDHRDALFALAVLAMEAGRSAEAESLLRLLLAAHPDDAQAWNELGAILHVRGEGEGAREALERALAADPFHPEALANAGLLAAGAGDRSRARILLDRLRELAPDSREAEALARALAPP